MMHGTACGDFIDDGGSISTFSRKRLPKVIESFITADSDM